MSLGRITQHHRDSYGAWLQMRNIQKWKAFFITQVCVWTVDGLNEELGRVTLRYFTEIVFTVVLK